MGKMKRPSKDEYYLGIALAYSKRSTCLLRRYGAIIVVDDAVVSQGYNGSPRGMENYVESGECPRMKAGCKPGEGYDLCIEIHAEANAVINAARTGAKVVGGILYVAGEHVETGKLSNATPCKQCAALIINSGVSKVISQHENEIVTYDPQRWVKNGLPDYSALNTPKEE